MLMNSPRRGPNEILDLPRRVRFVLSSESVAFIGVSKRLPDATGHAAIGKRKAFLALPSFNSGLSNTGTSSLSQRGREFVLPDQRRGNWTGETDREQRRAVARGVSDYVSRFPRIAGGSLGNANVL